MLRLMECKDVLRQLYKRTSKEEQCSEGYHDGKPNSFIDEYAAMA